MIVVSINTKTDGVSRVEFADGSLFSFKDCYCVPYAADSYVDGCEISDEEEAAFRFASACLRAETLALRLIARAEQNTLGISRKLHKRGVAPDCIRAVIAQLCDMNLLDDGRYARLWLESRLIRQATSPRRLFAALCARGIDRHDAEAALKTALDDDAEQQLLERYVRKHHGALTDDTDIRSLRYTLKGEGFSSAAIAVLLDR